MRTTLIVVLLLLTTTANAQFRLGDSPPTIRAAMLALGGKVDSTIISFNGTIWLNDYRTTVVDDTVTTTLVVTFEQDSVVSILTSLQGLELETFEKDYGWIIKHPQVDRGARDNVFRAKFEAGQSDYHLKYQLDTEHLIIEVTKPGHEPAMDDHLQWLLKKS